MSSATIDSLATLDLREQAAEWAAAARRASQRLATSSSADKNACLLLAADRIEGESDRIIAANQIDLANAPGFGLTDAAIDRLRLDRQRISAIAAGIRDVASLPDPIGETIETIRRPNGLDIRKIRTPLGVVFFIYESRPNVTADAAAICLKSGNAVLLRGGKEAAASSQAIVDLFRSAVADSPLPNDCVQMVPTQDRSAVGMLLQMKDQIDVVIPRGGKGLIERVTHEATMPVIKHFDGNCHVYIDAAADEAMAISIVVNGKCQRMGVCNATESLLIHRSIADRILPQLAAALQPYAIELRGDAAARKICPDAAVATEDDWGAEYLGPVLSVAIVDNVDAAIAHINRYGSGHTDAIVTDSLQVADRFAAAVDSAAVMINASTRFNDGGEFGFGAEIGISTDKFHARGPCGLRELTSYKYIVRGHGQVRQ